MSSVRVAAAVAALSLALLAPAARAAEGPTLVLTKSQLPKLATLVHDNADAAKVFDPIRKAADAALTVTPDPVPTIVSEGKLASNPDKKRTWKALDDMGRMSALSWTHVVTGDAKYAAKGREFILAWAKTNRSQGNPINDTNLEPLIVSYDLLADTFSPDDKQTVETYLRETYAAEYKTGHNGSHTNVNNWNSHRIKIEGLAAYALRDEKLVAEAIAEYKKQIGQNLKPDGSSIDFEERDALHYQEYDLRPLMTFAAAARNNGEPDLYAWAAPNGASLAKGMAFLKPFCEGARQHPEFVNSKVDFDRQRAAAGQAEYRAGRIWDPREGLGCVERAELWEPDLKPLAVKLSKSPGSDAYPTWQTVLNAVARP